eukprot:9525402-Lingulodinium_polyedra.AAC.1
MGATSHASGRPTTRRVATVARDVGVGCSTSRRRVSWGADGRPDRSRWITERSFGRRRRRRRTTTMRCSRRQR